jgi:hypothetical protein
MAYKVTIKNNTQRMHDYTITPAPVSPVSASEPTPITPVLYTCKLKPGAKGPYRQPSYDSTLHFCSTVMLDFPRFTIKATTSIITKEGFLPLTKEVIVDMEQDHGEELRNVNDVKLAIVDHRQEMIGDRVKGSGIRTEFIVTFE